MKIEEKTEKFNNDRASSKLSEQNEQKHTGFYRVKSNWMFIKNGVGTKSENE